MKKISLILFILLSIQFVTRAQKSIKLEKQQTNFYYGQLNLHGGFVSDINGDRWSSATRSPKNQAVFQFYSKNKRAMQRGYVKKISLDAVKFRMGFEYDNVVSDDGVQSGNINFKLYDTYVKFKTKYDRTSITIGNKSIPYGHNLKVDPVVSFMINPIKMDLGFGQDLGVFIKTPISKDLDVEFSLTSGGFLNAPVLVCNDLVVRDDNEIDLDPSFKFGKYDYQGTWLFTGRVGSPTFKSNEFGFILLTGRIESTVFRDELTDIYRTGIEWTYKYNERFKMTNQAVVGRTDIVDGEKHNSFNIVNNFEYYTGNHWLFAASHYTNALRQTNSTETYLNYSLAGSITYAFTPHTRLRLNSFYTYIKEADEKQGGILLQFVTGIGKRP